MCTRRRARHGRVGCGRAWTMSGCRRHRRWLFCSREAGVQCSCCVPAYRCSQSIEDVVAHGRNATLLHSRSLVPSQVGRHEQHFARSGVRQQTARRAHGVPQQTRAPVSFSTVQIQLHAKGGAPLDRIRATKPVVKGSYTKVLRGAAPATTRKGATVRWRVRVRVVDRRTGEAFAGMKDAMGRKGANGTAAERGLGQGSGGRTGA